MISTLLLPLLALELGAFAPDLGLETWIEPERENDSQTSEDGGASPADVRRMMEGGGPPVAGELGALHGQVVIVHTFDWERTQPDSEQIVLLRELAEANEDRELSLLGIAGELGEDEAREQLAELEIDWPVALAPADFDSPYLGAGTNAFVIGPNRALLFAGDATKDEKDFLEAIQLGFGRPVAPMVEHALAPGLEQAWELYVTGELSKASKQAEKVEKKARKASDGTLSNDAAELVQLVRKAQTEWIADLRAALSRRDGKTFVRRSREVARAFPRGEAKEQLAELEQEARKQTGFTNSLRDNELWFDAAPDRPPLFPVRRSREGDRYAKQLEKLVKSTSNSLEVTRTANRMLRRYRGEGS